MKTDYKLLLLVISSVSMLPVSVDAATGDSETIRPITALGAHHSPDKKFKVVLRINAMGGFKDLFVMKKDEPIFYAANVNAYFWVDSALIYSSLPLYGEAGIFVFDAKMETTACLVAGKDSEYFELGSFVPMTSRIAYYYSSDIEHLDVAHLKRSKEALREIVFSPSN